jgi:predicted aspartyl protease
LLQNEGLEILKLQRQKLTDQKMRKSQPKHLVVKADLNRVSASLMVDTGTPMTNIARDKLERFGLTEQQTSSRVTSPLGSASDKFYGIGKLNTLVLGNCVIQDVPVLIDAIPFIDGVLGSDDMRRIGAVLDCGEPALYYAPHGARPDTSNKLTAMLQGEGFIHVPMRLRSDHRLEVNCSIDGIPSTIIVDTGSLATCLDRSIAIRAGITMKQTKTVVLGSGGASAPVQIGRVKQFDIGDFKIRDAALTFVDLAKPDSPPDYILGIGELVSNNAIIDLGALSLYLRH